jgi:hypothetical protein
VLEVVAWLLSVVVLGPGAGCWLVREETSEVPRTKACRMESSRIKLFPAKSSFIAYHAPRGAVDFVDASRCRHFGY